MYSSSRTRVKFPKGQVMTWSFSALLLLSILSIISCITPVTYAAKSKSTPGSSSSSVWQISDIYSSISSATPTPGILKLTDTTYDKLTRLPLTDKSGVNIVGADGRDYGVVVLLTAMGKDVNCGPCKLHDPEYKALASQWFKKHKKPYGDNRDLVFAVLDYKDGQRTYASLQLNVAPTLAYWPPTSEGKSKDRINYSFDKHGFSAEGLSRWLSGVHTTKVPYSRPIDYSKLVIPTVALISTLGCAFVLKNQIFFIFASRILWAIFTIGWVLTMTGGYMWNKIRTPAWMERGSSGLRSYFVGGYSNQNGIETPLIAILYGTLAMSVLMLCLAAPKIRDPTRQRISVYLWTGILITLFGMLMSIFRIKQGAYPFKLIF